MWKTEDGLMKNDTSSAGLLQSLCFTPCSFGVVDRRRAAYHLYLTGSLQSRDQRIIVSLNDRDQSCVDSVPTIRQGKQSNSVLHIHSPESLLDATPSRYEPREEGDVVNRLIVPQVSTSLLILFYQVVIYVQSCLGHGDSDPVGYRTRASKARIESCRMAMISSICILVVIMGGAIKMVSPATPRTVPVHG
jgi:hypothetical protein